MDTGGRVKAETKKRSRRGQAAKTNENTKERLLRAAAILFAEASYDTVSIRDICDHAGISITAVHHHFGSKEKLLHAIFEQINESVIEAPLRILARGSKTKEEFSIKFKLFLEETLLAMLKIKNELIISFNESRRFGELIDNGIYQDAIMDFYSDAQDKGFVSKSIDLEMISGALVDRLAPQVIQQDQIKASFHLDIEDQTYRTRWVNANADLFLSGLLSRE